jgi:predicted metalloprotease with PDZ domain
LFLRAGLIVRKDAPGKPSIGDVRLQAGAGGSKVASQVLFDSPLYKAGAEQDDVIVSVDGVDLTQGATLDTILARHKPGDTMSIRFVRRSGERVDGTITLDEDPRVEVVPIESAGGTLTGDQQRFREAWLNAQ